MQSTLNRRVLLVSMSLPIFGLSASRLVVAQEDDASPVPEDIAESRAFEFFPLETGWGTVLDVTIEPGESVNELVLLGNTGSVTQDINAYRVNAFTAEGGGFTVAESAAGSDDVTSWIEFPDDIYTIEPGMGVEISLRISIPNDVEPGEYVTAIAAEHAESLEIEGSEVLRQKIRYVIPIFITVPGPAVAGLEIGDVALINDEDEILLSIELFNSGRVHIRPEGEVAIRDANGELVTSIPVAMGQFFAGDETILTVSVPESIGTGTYDVQIDLADEAEDFTVSSRVNGLLVEAIASPVAYVPLSIASTTLEPSPSADDVQFVTVSTLIFNDSDPVANAQLSLIAYVDGQEVERFPVSQSLSLNPGETEVTTRYIPVTGWSSGEWTFELLLETVDETGAAVVVELQPIEMEVIIP